MAFRPSCSAAALTALLVATGCVAGVPRPAPGPLDAEAARRAETWLAQRYGGDAVEGWEIQASGRRIAFSVARKWTPEGAKVLVFVHSTAGIHKPAYLLLPQRGRSDDLFFYDRQRTFSRIRRLPAALLDLPFLEVGSAFPIADVRPFLSGELVHRDIGPATVDGESCKGVESRPAARDLGFERMELWISDATGVALRTLYYRRGREIRRVLVSAGDVRLFAGRLLPWRRTFEAPGGGSAVLVLRNLMLDADLPDQLFTSLNLREAQRFPSF